MKTLLIPVDFTDTSNNAISYAVEWSKTYGYESIILLKSMYGSLFESIVVSSDYMNVNQDYKAREHEEAKEKLNQLCEELIAKVAPGIKVFLAVSEDPLQRAILDMVRDENPQLVVVGSDNYNYSSNSFVAGNVIGIARISPVRVLIVPSHFQYKPVEQALVPVDFNTIDTLTKLHAYQSSSPLWKKKKILVLNVDPKEKYLNKDEDLINKENALHDYLKNFDHEVYYSNDKNIMNGIIEFSRTHDVQMIIALPGKYSFLYTLTHKSISEAVYKNAKKPVLILK